MLCYQVFAPFLTLMVWALILAVALYPLHQRLAARMGGRQGWRRRLIALARRRADRRADRGADEFARRLGAAASSRRAEQHAADPAAARRVSPNGRWSARRSTRSGRRRMPTCRRWSRACSRRSATSPRRRSVSSPASAAGILAFLASFIIAGIIMAFGEAGAARQPGDLRAHRRPGARRGVRQAVDGDHPRRRAGRHRRRLHPGHHRRPALLVAGVPLAGVLAVVVLVLGIAQVPALIVTLPAIAYIWMSGDYGTGEAIVYTVLLFVAGMADNVLKPLMLGRGVDAPMPVILLGALGGMAAGGILGMFVGADAAGAGLPDLHGLGVPPTRADTARADSRPTERCPRTSAATPAAGAPGCGARPRCWRAAARRSGRTSSAPKCRGSRTGARGRSELAEAHAPPRRGRAARRVVAELRRPGARQLVAEAQRLEPERAHCRPAHHGGARPARHRRQRALSAAAAAERPGVCGRAGHVGRPEPRRSAATARRSTSPGRLDFWGKFRRGIEAADAAYFASIAQYDDVQVLVAAQAASFYATIRTIELRLRIAHENAALQQRSLEITERLFQSGNESELDVQQAQIAVPGHAGDHPRAGERACARRRTR